MNLIDLLTDTERKHLETRRSIALALETGRTYAEIVELLNVSPKTVAQVKKILDRGGE